MKKIIILTSFLFLVSCGANKENISNSGSLENNSWKIEILTWNISENSTWKIENPVTSSYENYQKRSRDTKRMMDLNILAVSVETYFVDKNEYPEKLEDLSKDFFREWKLPKDPSLDGRILNDCEFGYKYEKEEKGYRLSTCLEADEKLEAKNDWWIYENKYEKFSPAKEEKNSEN